MLSCIATYLSSFRSDPRTQPNRPTNAATTRETSPADPAKDARRTQQSGDAKSGDAKSGDAKSGDAKPSPVPLGSSRTRPASAARADAIKPATTAETKPPVAAAVPPAPPLEDFEE
jgi:hypothetical protein